MTRQSFSHENNKKKIKAKIDMFSQTTTADAHTWISAHMFSNARVENVGHCHFPCRLDCQTTLHCLQLKALITILLQHVIILMLSMEMNWPTIDLQ